MEKRVKINLTLRDVYIVNVFLKGYKIIPLKFKECFNSVETETLEDAELIANDMQSEIDKLSHDSSPSI